MGAPDILAYVTGLYEPVDSERTAVDLEVEGELPEDLFGVMAQNAPNPRFEPLGPYHWFDGDGMVHAVELRGGKATYRNRWIQTEALATDLHAGRATRPGILAPFDPSDPSPDRNTANTDLIVHDGRLLALWWLGGAPYALSLPELDTVGPVDFAGTLSCGVAAHPKVDPRTGELVFFDYDPYRKPHLQLGVADTSGRVVHHAVVDLPRPSLFHDIAITEHHTILLDFPMWWDTDRMAQGKRRVRFDPDGTSRYGIVPRRGDAGDIRWFEGPACYSYHTINAWEETSPEGHAVVVLVGCRIADPLPRTDHDTEPEIPRLAFLRLEPYLHEWRFDLTTGQLTERRLDDVPTEFPRMNDEWLGRKARYSYNPRVGRERTLLFDGVVRYDLETGSSTSHTWGPQQFGGETVFAPRPGATAEDDGWVLAFVNDRRDRSSALHVLDGRDIAAGPVARVKIPHRVPVGFHAQWAPLGRDA